MSATGRTERRRIQCHACPNQVTLEVTLGMWHERFVHCVDRAAEIMGFVMTEKGPACGFHKGQG